jgi:hypothetical protein
MTEENHLPKKAEAELLFSASRLGLRQMSELRHINTDRSVLYLTIASLQAGVPFSCHHVPEIRVVRIQRVDIEVITIYLLVWALFPKHHGHASDSLNASGSILFAPTREIDYA